MRRIVNFSSLAAAEEIKKDQLMFAFNDPVCYTYHAASWERRSNTLSTLGIFSPSSRLRLQTTRLEGCSFAMPVGQDVAPLPFSVQSVTLYWTFIVLR
ncbi:unnamed protein product [Camellia sinensis]